MERFIIYHGWRKTETFAIHEKYSPSSFSTFSFSRLLSNSSSSSNLIIRFLCNILFSRWPTKYLFQTPHFSLFLSLVILYFFLEAKCKDKCTSVWNLTTVARNISSFSLSYPFIPDIHISCSLSHAPSIRAKAC